jgi:hypothetical protein
MSEKAAPLLCKDCRFGTSEPPGKFLFFDGLCTHPTSLYQPRLNLLTGEPVATYPLPCKETRADPDRCGEDGRHWVARE